MLLGGLWHGASLTFVLWGVWHGLGLMVNRWWDQRSRAHQARFPAWLGWLTTQAFVLYGWMLFRAGSIDQVLAFTSALGSFSMPGWWGPYVRNLTVLAAPLVAMQLWQWRSGNLNATLGLPRWTRAVLQGTMVLIIIAFWEPEASPFIYFQF